MLKNLLKTWENLAPNEELSFSDEEAILGDNLRVFQGYIQRCIRDRGWYWNLHQFPNCSKAYVIDNQVHQYECSKEADAVHEVLLTAYLQTLAAQRAITPNSD
jgi:hypothetical protein